MTDAQQREAARQFFYRWNGRGKEDEDARSYWIEILSNILGVTNVTERVSFEKKVIGSDGNTKRIDVYIPETRVLIEQKSLGIALDKPQAGHGSKTPYEQAKEYDNGLPFDEKSQWIITSNFAEIWIYNMSVMRPVPVKLSLADLQTQYNALAFLVKKEEKKVNLEMELSIQAGEIVGKIHDRFLEQYNDPLAKHTQRSLNILCVRLVFCLYAEDAGLFGSTNAFHDYIAQYAPKDVRRALIDLFQVLNTPLEERADMYLPDDLAAFPYVNGGLFKEEHIIIPKITPELKDVILESSLFDWSKISPTIFGAVFESTLNPETRRSGGMHYTSIENIHKVIDPLFLDDLKAELAEINSIAVVRTRNKKLEAFQDKLASLRFLDPAAGSGNFLTESYTCLRRLENQVIQSLSGGQMTLGEVMNPIKVSISQFYGIEINDFAVTVAKTALWIAECQMMQETEDIIHMQLDFLPLKTSAKVVEGNALRIDWNEVVDKSKLSYIMGNPPFVGKSFQTIDQKEDMGNVFNGTKNYGNLDYVTCWYKLAADYIENTNIVVAFVSTNSICQGIAVPPLWHYLQVKKHIKISFAYQTFIWKSEATDAAGVHCVIVGFTNNNKKAACLYDSNGHGQIVKNINAYLIDAPNIIIVDRHAPISDVPKMAVGSFPTDGGNLVIQADEIEEFLKKEPKASSYIRRYIGPVEFINRRERYCLWLKDCSPSELNKMPAVMKRISAVREYRLSSPKIQTQKRAETPMLFAEDRQPSSDYILVPRTSSERRRYVPMGFLGVETIAGDTIILPNATLYHFGVLESNVHMSWMRVVCGRLKSDYRYSNTIVYNNFPWPTPSDSQKQKIEQTAQGILDARALYPDASLADLYDPLTMPPELRKAHQRNDAAVMQAYGMPIKETDEAACVAWLMRLYQEKIEELSKSKK